MAFDRDQVMAALRAIRDPEAGKDIVSAGRVKDVRMDGDVVWVAVEAVAGTEEAARRAVEGAVKGAGASEVEVQVVTVAAKPKAAGPLPQVRHVIAVGAGKGGVGKSTIAVNVAVGLQRLGHRVGFMDGDIYGPSAPTLLGIKGVAPAVRGAKILPHYVHGLHAVTIGSLVEQDKPLIWRGPMAHGAFKQLLADNTDWPELDYLIVDLPPGTGDVALTLCQTLQLTGAVVVVTPQQVAVDDAVRAVRMFQQLGTSVLGIVENMSGDLFGRGGGERMAQSMNLPFLGAVPAVAGLRENSDAGTPTRNFEGDAALKAALEGITKGVLREVEAREALGRGPELSIS
jgi:ATP-binding protein involved in chromosome partitioning